METYSAPAGKTDATAAQPKPPHEVEEFFKGWVLLKFDAVGDKNHVSDFMSINEIWKLWAPHRYQPHIEEICMPTLPELRNAMTPTKISYNDSRFHMIGEWRTEE